MAKRNFNFKKVNVDLNGLRDALTDTISTVADKVLDLADAAADTAKVGQQVAKLYVEKKKEESALEDAYLELGRLYYELHKQDAEGVIADLCREIENTLVNIEDITAEIEALKASADGDVDVDIPEADDDDFEPVKEAEDFVERVAEKVEEVFEGLDEAIEAAIEKVESIFTGEEAAEDGEIEVTVEEYLDDDDFVAPEQDNDVEVEIVEIVEEAPEAPVEE